MTSAFSRALSPIMTKTTAYAFSTGLSPLLVRVSNINFDPNIEKGSFCVHLDHAVSGDPAEGHFFGGPLPLAATFRLSKFDNFRISNSDDTTRHHFTPSLTQDLLKASNACIKAWRTVPEVQVDVKVTTDHSDLRAKEPKWVLTATIIAPKGQVVPEMVSAIQFSDHHNFSENNRIPS